MLNHSFWAEICTLLKLQSIGQSHWWGILLPSHVPAKFFSKWGGVEGWLCFEYMWSVLLSLLLWVLPISTCCSRLCSIWWEGYFLADVRTEKDSSTVQKQEQQYPAWVTWVDIIWVIDAQSIAGNYFLYFGLGTITTLDKYEENMELKHMNRLRKYSST